MTQFKIGDTVVLIEDYAGEKAGTVFIVQGVYASIEHSDGGLYHLKGLRCNVFGRRLRLHATGDALPPAPESTMYFNSTRDGGNDQRLIINQSRDYKYRVSLGIVPRGDNTTKLAINLDADAALQLCHDLRRMAMDIKRKEKQDA